MHRSEVVLESSEDRRCQSTNFSFSFFPACEMFSNYLPVLVISKQSFGICSRAVLSEVLNLWLQTPGSFTVKIHLQE